MNSEIPKARRIHISVAVNLIRDMARQHPRTEYLEGVRAGKATLKACEDLQAQGIEWISGCSTPRPDGRCCIHEID